MTDNYAVGVRKDGVTHFLHNDYPFDEPVSGGGFFDNFARAIESADSSTDVAEVFDNLGYNEDSGCLCWTVDQPHLFEHKIPVWDVAQDRVYVTEDGTPASVVTWFTRTDFVNRYKR